MSWWAVPLAITILTIFLLHNELDRKQRGQTNIYDLYLIPLYQKIKDKYNSK